MHPSRPPKHRRSATAALLAAPVLALALAACSPSAPSPASSSSGSPAGSSSRSPTGSPASSSGAASGAVSGAVSDADRDAARDAYDLELARCIRTKGVDVKDPQPGEGFNDTGPGVQAAASACAAQLPPPPLMTSAEEEQVREIYLKVAACLRERGYDVADPAPDQALALTSDVPQSDVKACESAK